MPQITTQTVLIDLSKQENDFFNSLDKDIRYDIRKAKKKNISVEVRDDEASKKECYLIYTEMCRKHFIDIEPFERLFVEGNILFVAIFNNKIISFAIIGKRKNDERKGVMTLKYNSTLDEYTKLQPTTLLYWECMLWTKNNGYKQFDLGGIDLKSRDPQTQNRNKFKLNWGGEIVELKANYNLPRWIYWKYLRHYSFVRKMKYLVKGK